MDAFYERLIVRAPPIDELLSDDFEPLPGQKGDTDLAARRLAAWCRSCASGDWSLFGRRLDRDGWTVAHVTAKFDERFVKGRKTGETPPDAARPQHEAGTSRYDQFVAEMKTGGFRGLFE